MCRCWSIGDESWKAHELRIFETTEDKKRKVTELENIESKLIKKL